MPVPARIKIIREEDFYTDKIGKCKDGRQFMAFVVASLPDGTGPLPHDWRKHKRWHAVLHTFDKFGKHLKSDVWTAGCSADGEDEVIRRARTRLSEMLAALGSVKYCDVSVCHFRVEVDGRVFGLVDASVPDEDYESIHLLPNDLAFFPPWDGTYDT